MLPRFGGQIENIGQERGVGQKLSSFSAPIRTALLVLFCVTMCRCSPTTPTGVYQAPPRPGPNFLDAQLAECPNAALLTTVREAPVTWTGGITADPLVCTADAGSADLTRKQERIYQALIIMKQLRFDRPLPWTADTLWDWFIGQVHQIRVSDINTNSNCCGNDGHTISLNLPNPITDLSWYGEETMVVGTVHEARHIVAGQHTCGYTRDDRVDDLNGYGVAYYLLVWLGTYSNPATFPIEYRPLMLFYACAMRNSAFCLEPKTSCQ